MSVSKKSLSKCLTLGVSGLLAFSGHSAASSYSELLATMQVRQAELEKEQLAKDTCLGEQLDGYLKINYNCSPEVNTLAEDENNDRKALYTLMAKSLGTQAQAIGIEWAKRRHPRYIKGVMRQIRLDNGTTTFWNGIGEHPDVNSVARVLTLKNAKLYSSADKSADVLKDNLQLYEAFGVVKQENKNGTRWYQVTEEYVPKQKPANWQPQTIGWIPADQVIPWKRALVMRFTNSLNRDRSVFFKKKEDAIALVKASSTDRKTQLDKLYAQFDKVGSVNDISGALAIEPKVGRDQEQVVMYPLLEFYKPESEALSMDMDDETTTHTHLLKVAAQTRGGSGTVPKGKVPPVDIVFVMDLTNSMKPYLEQLLAVVEEYALERDGQDIRFGFVGYQDKHKDFDFTAETFTPTGLVSATEFVGLLSKIEARETPVKADDIPEAVMEGVSTALEKGKWREKSAKALVLIGDAPGREDNLLTVRELRDKAYVRGIPIYSIYIDSSRGAAKYAQSGKEQYTQLSSTYDGAYGSSREKPHISIVDGGSPQKFRSTVVSGLFDNARLLAVENYQSDKVEEGSLAELLFQQAELIWADQTMPDDSVVGWVTDKVMTSPSREALAPMILLNEAELDELIARVRELKDIGEMAAHRGDGTTLDFFDLVSANTRFTIVDPSAVNFRDAFSAPLGINSLPYDSDIMALTRKEFYSKDRVLKFLRAMDNKLRHYEDLKRQLSNPYVWKKLSTGTSDHDRVVSVELNQLP